MQGAYVVFAVPFQVERTVVLVAHPWCGDQIGREHVTVEPAVYKRKERVVYEL